MPTRIDNRGLHRSNIFLLRRAIRKLEVQPDYILTDGWPVRGMPLPHLSIKKGDAVTASIAAASIFAKVLRDRMMERYHRRFPEYGFDHNRGYGTRHHWDTLDRLGPTPIHRMSFKGVARRWESVEEAVAAEDEMLPDADGGPADAPELLAATVEDR
jgi:ribonuclease HII